jgi:hypothetical protein
MPRAYAPGLVRQAYLRALEGDEKLLREVLWIPTLTELGKALGDAGQASSSAEGAIRLVHSKIFKLKGGKDFTAQEFHNTIAHAVCSLERATRSASGVDTEHCSEAPTATAETAKAFKRYSALVERHPQVLVVPTVRILDISDYEEISGLPVVFAGVMTEAEKLVDGKKLGPSNYFDHDLLHGERWSDASTNLFPAQGLNKDEFRSRLAQRLAEREAFLKAIEPLRSGSGPRNFVGKLVRNGLEIFGGPAPGEGAPLTSRERVDAFDFYMFHELRLEFPSEAGLVPCPRACWSIPAIFERVEEEWANATLESGFGRPLARLRFRESDVSDVLKDVGIAIQKHLRNNPPGKATPESAQATLSRFR